MTSQPLLILSCSKRKKETSLLLPAIDRYDGPLFQVLRRHVRDKPALKDAAFILSARFGLIPAEFPIPLYDQPLSTANESLLKGAVANQVRMVIEQIRPDAVFVSVGGHYWQLLEQSLAQQVAAENLFVASGGIGGRASQLSNWLGPVNSQSQIETVNGSGEATLLGTTIRLRPEEIFYIAKNALVEDPNGAYRFETWFVELGADRIAVKWLVSILFGKPVASFRTADARRVLALLGVECKYQAF